MIYDDPEIVKVATEGDRQPSSLLLSSIDSGNTLRTYEANIGSIRHGVKTTGATYVKSVRA